ncbi:tRNA 5-methoxyuridine(34)/uridine 5-oxyacetic acid(34) synthase CmoB [Helicobacter apodemus]|uniref:tRNA 5-methoxyuridine(34)/uridine 5-oxyacetic acid(34) synthase CmoB n=1 Tax=Helicobacter apodemus TaxID=135569 RepID=A0A4U8UE50_9HELI|nr:tRNA 5-methoxyuridine(34)/uridine 5-oxyacetic acid(34) synthase CmoB [Helicobacter apodemus]TLE16209.1 tRNA 5-methoxyuridine(34)/uridine 5-oxyacetic acid(34) synthase CmoB [Helicobacter apodemus]
MLQSIRAKRNLALSFKNNIALMQSLELLGQIPKEELEGASLRIGDFIEVSLPALSKDTQTLIYNVAASLIPWRKGPFKIHHLTIDSEWNSAIKYNLLESHLNLQNKIVGDIGCNNGYYMFRMLSQNPRYIVGLDPIALCKLQFDFMQFFINDKRIKFELLGIEDLPFLGISFDVLLCLGVLYHKKSPLDCIKMIYNALKQGGEAIFDSIIIPGKEAICLCPKGSYAKMKNVYFIPTLSTFINWLEQCGFKEIKHIATLKTERLEQRKTPWSNKESLEDFLDSTFKQTVEGYPAPQRAYLKARK